MKFAGAALVAAVQDAARARHAEMHQQYFARRQIRQQILGTTPHSGDGCAFEPLVEVLRKRKAQIRPALLDLISAGLHRVWKDALVTAINPPKSDREFALLDVAGGTGDVSFRTIAAGGYGTPATVADINPEMLAV